jgi:hypothetical protein
MKNPGGLLTFTAYLLVSPFKFSWPGFYTLYHHHQVIPMDVQRGGILIKGREFFDGNIVYCIV